MSRSLHPKANYSRICAECRHHDDNSKFTTMCNVSVDVVTGKPLRVAASEQRAVKGACGPDGKRWEAPEQPAKTNGASKPNLRAVAN